MVTHIMYQNTILTNIIRMKILNLKVVYGEYSAPVEHLGRLRLNSLVAFG